MIPKIIHLCWLSGDPYPTEIQACLDTWKKFLPDYEVWLWDTKRFDVHSTQWTEQAFAARKYAFAADYIRLYALYNYGGIYLDADVLVYKSFDPLLSLPYFIGEDHDGSFEAAVIGAEKHLPFIKHLLDYYDGRSFVKEDGSYETDVPLPLIFRKQLMAGGYAFRRISGGQDYTLEEGVLNIFPFDYFNSRDRLGARKYANSYCSHNFAGSWCGKPKGAKDRLKRSLPRPLLRMTLAITSWLHRKRLREYKIPFT